MKKLLISFFFIASILFGQKKGITQQALDSIDLYKASAQKLDSFKMYLEQDERLIGWSYYHNSKAVQQYFEKEYDSVLYYDQKAINYYNASTTKRTIDTERIIYAYFFMATVYIIKKDYKLALEYLQKSLDLSKKHPGKLYPFIIGGIGNCHLKLGNIETALAYFKKTLKDSIYMATPKSFIVGHTKLGVIYSYDKVNIDSAKYYLKKALDKSIQTNFKGNITAIHANLGYLYEKRNQIDSALYHYKEQIKANEDFKPEYTHSQLFVLTNKIYVQTQEQQYKKALSNLQILEDTISKIEVVDRNDQELYQSFLDRYILYYRKTNNHDEAYKLYEKKASFLENFYEKLVKDEINDLQIEYESKEKDQSINQLEKTNEIQNNLIKQQHIIAIGLGVLLVLFLALGTVLFRQKNLQNKYEKVNLEQRLLRSQMDPHFIFNALNVISGLVQKKSEKSNPYIANFSSLLRLILNNSREEFVLLEDEVLALENYLILQSDFNSAFKYAITVDASLDKDKICVPPMLIQPFVENSVEHGIKKSENGEIDIRLTAINDQDLIECCIEDNGIGYTKAKESKRLMNSKYESLSTSIVQERLEIYKKKFKKTLQFKIEEIVDASNEVVGTRVIMTIPYLEA